MKLFIKRIIGAAKVQLSRHTAFTAVLAFACCLLVQPTKGTAQRAQAPVCQFGTFNMQSSLNRCLSLAGEAMTRQNYTLFEKRGYVRLGGNAGVIVEVACVPTGQGTTTVTVSAFSSDSKRAELARNEVRTYIETTKDF